MTKHNDEHQDEGAGLYEIGYLVVPTVAQEQLPGVVEEIHKIIKGQDAEIVAEGAPMLQELAYEIAKVSVGKRVKFNTAYFGHVVFKTVPASAPIIKKALDTNDKLLRYILIKTDAEVALAPKVSELPETEEAKTSPEDLDKKIDTLATI